MSPAPTRAPTRPSANLSARPSAVALARIAARSMCPTCDERDPLPGEEDYASCFFCAFTNLDTTDGQGDGQEGHAHRSAQAPRTHGS